MVWRRLAIERLKTTGMASCTEVGAVEKDRERWREVGAMTNDVVWQLKSMGSHGFSEARGSSHNSQDSSVCR